MTQDARLGLSNIGWLIAAIALVSAPHLPRQPLWISAVCVAVLALRGYLALA